MSTETEAWAQQKVDEIETRCRDRLTASTREMQEEHTSTVDRLLQKQLELERENASSEQRYTQLEASVAAIYIRMIRLRKVFRTLDIDHAGSVAREDLACLLVSFHFANRKPSIFQRLLRGMISSPKRICKANAWFQAQ